MSNLNTAVRYTPDAQPNAAMNNVTEQFRDRDNADFLAYVANQLASFPSEADKTKLTIHRDGMACIGLIGRFGFLGSTLRRAQEVVRFDHLPSYWSHSFLVSEPLSNNARDIRNSKKSPWIWESTLEPGEILSPLLERNGVSARPISDYSQGRFSVKGSSAPNIAMISIALTADERDRVIGRADDPDIDQLRYDLSSLLGTWYSYLTNPYDIKNPLTEGLPHYSSAYLQFAYDAAGIDLAPGAHQRNISPEHIWQASKRLNSMLIASSVNGERINREVVGWYCIRDQCALPYPPEKEIPLNLSALVKLAKTSLHTRRKNGDA